MSDQPKKKNFFAKHKVLTVILVLIILAIIGGASGGNKGTSSSTSGSKAANTAAKQYRFAERADKQAKDVELLPNESGTVGGVKLTVTSIQYATSLGQFDTADSGKTYVVANVSLEKTSKGTQSYNEFDFRTQTAGGQVLDSAVVTSVTNLLNSGDLVAGGKVSGNIAFQVPIEDGHQYLIWKPGFSSDRAIVQMK